MMRSARILQRSSSIHRQICQRCQSCQRRRRRKRLEIRRWWWRWEIHRQYVAFAPWPPDRERDALRASVASARLPLLILPFPSSVVKRAIAVFVVRTPLDAGIKTWDTAFEDAAEYSVGGHRWLISRSGEEKNIWNEYFVKLFIFYFFFFLSTAKLTRFSYLSQLLWKRKKKIDLCKLVYVRLMGLIKKRNENVRFILTRPNKNLI